MSQTPINTNDSAAPVGQPASTEAPATNAATAVAPVTNSATAVAPVTHSNSGVAPVKQRMSIKTRTRTITGEHRSSAGSNGEDTQASGKPAGTAQPLSIDGARLHGQLHDLTTKGGDEASVRAAFRAIVLEHTGGIGVGHVLMNEQSEWEIGSEMASGRLPSRPDFVEKFGKCCTATIQRNSIQIESFLGLESIYSPIQVAGSQPEVLMVLTEEKNASRTLFVLEIVSAYFCLWLKEARSERSTWKMNSLAALIELVSQIENQISAHGACQVAASELARYLNCDQVAIGFIRKGKLNVEAVSSGANLKQDSETLRAFDTALSESLLRNEVAVWPTPDDSTEALMLGHQQLARKFHCQAVLSTPLTLADGKTIGVMIVTGSSELLHGDRLPNFVRAATSRIASAIDVVRRSEKNNLQRLFALLKNQTATWKGRLWYAVAAVLLAVMLVPVPYKIRCHCTTEPTQKRFAVAPFDGLVKRGFVEPGDVVAAGQLLAKMDGQPIRFELAGVTAELNQASRKREIELSGRNVPASLLADLESQRLQARKDQLEFQQEQIEIRSPFDGVVLSGSLERAEGASVQTGKVLFEVAPLDSLKVEVSIPAEEMALARVGQSARVWIQGLENQSFTGTISRIHPRSQLRDGQNVFVAEVTVRNPDSRLRPGMQGQARIDCAARPLAWNLFHKPWNFITSRLTWW